MQRISVYIPEETKKMINFAAKANNKAESEIIRAALNEGLKTVHPVSRSAQALVELARLAQKIPTRGKVPMDAVENMDYYTWGGDKRE